MLQLLLDLAQGADDTGNGREIPALPGQGRREMVLRAICTFIVSFMTLVSIAAVGAWAGGKLGFYLVGVPSVPGQCGLAALPAIGAALVGSFLGVLAGLAIGTGFSLALFGLLMPIDEDDDTDSAD
jgi:hypothetical protein